MKITEALRNELAQWLDTYWTTYLEGDLETWATFIRDDYRNIGGTKEEIWNSKQEIMDYTYRIMDQMLGTVEIRNRQIDVIPYGQYMMVHEFTDLYVKIEGEWTLYGPFRMSSLLEKTDKGWIALHQHGSYPDMKALEGEAFSYDAIKAENVRLQEAVKSRTIELEIEAALERVRAVAMGMKKPEDMLDVCRVISVQLQQFGVEGVRNVQTVIINENIGQYLCYQYFPSYDQITVEDTEYHKSPVEHEMVNRMLACCDGHFIGSLSGEKLDDFKQHRKEENHFPDPLLDEASELGYCFLSIGEGGLGLSLYHRMNDEVLTLFKRFHQVFSLAYQRFRDIQKAEDQAREAFIETALERVRSRTMAMHDSNELLQVINVLADQIRQLGLHADAVSFITDSDEKGYNMWLSSPGDSFLSKVYVPRINDKTTQIFRKALEEGKDIYSLTLSKDEKDIYFLNFFNNTILKGFPDEEKQEVFDAPGMSTTNVILAKIVLSVSNFSAIPYTEAGNIIIKRFAFVFQQAYTRFLDLQKAEEQAREAQIEAALERVRSSTMGMQRSEDMAQTASEMFRHIQTLGMQPWGCGFNIFDKDEKAVTQYMSLADGGISPPFRTPLTEDPFFVSIYDARQRKDELLVMESSGESLAETYRYMFGLPGSGEIFGDLEHSGFEMPKYQITYCAYFSQGYLVFITYEPVPEAQDIFKRFAKVFEQTYTRFLDLKRAEAQAREAQIEVALERTRTQSMLMQHSGELNEISKTFHEQLLLLGIDSEFSFVWLPDEEKNEHMFWATWVSDEDGSHQYHSRAINFPLDKTEPGTAACYVAWESGEPAIETYVAPGDIVAFFATWEELLRGAEKLRPEFFTEGIYYTEAYMKYGCFGIDIRRRLAADEKEIIRRFAVEFERTYTRFLDLKKAEAQALEAIKRASVDRVRAEIASMRTTSDLERIQPLIWNELKTLDVPFIRCGVFIMDEDKQELQSFLSTPDGKSIAAFHLPYHSTEQSKQIVAHWQQKQLFKDHMDEAAFAEYTKNLVKQGAVASDEKYVTENRPTDLFLYFLPFLQGMLYVGNNAALKDDEIQLVQNLADAFSTAYARYEDFNKLEAAKKQVDSTLNELQATQKQLVQSEKMASLGELTAGIAHEIQNPLNFVNNFSEVSKELLGEMKEELAVGNWQLAKDIASDVEQNLDKIHHHGKRADAIVKGMLLHSRTGSGQLEPTDLNALCDEYLRLAYHGLKAKDPSFNASFHFEPDKTLPKVNVVPQDIGRVLLNLINNAFQAVHLVETQCIAFLPNAYTPTVTVSTQNYGGYIEISVCDNGPGIPDSIKDKIFQPFFTTKPTGQGTGLGLSLSYDIVKAHGGELKVETTEREGSVFSIVLPI